MERREPSVRELFRTASALAQTFVMRPASGHAHSLGLVRQGSGSGHGGTQFHRSQDVRSASRQAQGSVKGSDSSTRPNSPSPDDMA